MKNFAMHLLCILCACLPLSNTLFATNPPNPIIDWSTGPLQGEHHYSIGQLPADVTSAFWILGDGQFRTGLTPSHYLLNNTNSHVKAYLLSPYELIPPPMLTCGNCTTNTVSNQPNPRVFMGPSQLVKIGTSWNPTRGQKHYTILTFENPGTSDGSIMIDFNQSGNNNVSSVQFDILDNNSDWYDNLIIDNTNKQIRFTFSGLDPGDQRNLLIETEVAPNTSGRYIDYFVEVTNKEGDTYSITPSSEIKRYPHDPNNKEVSESLICAHNNEVIELEYRIDFQNEGDNYAEVVRIKDNLPPNLDYASFQLVSSSHACQVIQSEDKLEIVFNHIELPGLDQTYPYIFHPNDTKGYVIFRIDANPCLEEHPIKNEAAIFFDSLAPIVTPFAITEVLLTDYCWMNNISCDDNDDDDGTGEQGPPPMGLVVDYSNFEVYPNPIRDQFFIDFDLLDNAVSDKKSLIIYNLQGMVVADLSKEINSEKGEQHLSIDASSWSNGIYFVKLEDINGPRTWKIIKTKE